LAVLKPFQLSIVKELIGHYHFDQPFHHYFAAQCRLHKNWGSKDRKIYKNACYAYFRLGFLIRQASLEANILLASQEKENLLTQIAPADIFPYPEWLSKQLDVNQWAMSLLDMRPVYLAIKNGCDEQVKDWLKTHQIDFEVVANGSIQVKADSKCNELVEKGWAWIMDIASQMAAESIELTEGEKVWDACSGAGGKALYLTNAYHGNIDLTCSDLRLTVLENLKQRFYTTGLKLPHIELTDLNEPFQLKYKYDKIILDVPCSGSGTWGRTPENISVITAQKVHGFSTLQRNIVRNAIRNLGSEGTVYYMTCSVFHEENESNVHYFIENFGLKLISDSYLFTDYNKSDVLYVAKMCFKSQP
jgi:16S rRNA (cytosine967-C5)-methyltransferase